MARRVFASRAVVLGAAVTFLLIFSCFSFAQQLAKRLILKDGSYQLATEWKVEGERVRYFSAERNEWEELPNSLVDWTATDKYQKDRAAGVPLPEAVEFDKKLAAERAAEEAKRPEVAPGLHLPADDGVLVLDTFDSEPELVPVEEKVAQVKRNGKSEMVCHTPEECVGNQVPTVKDMVELPGPHAEVQVHAEVPVLYVKLESAKEAMSSPQQLDERFQIIQVQSKKDRRIVGAIRVNINGKAKQEQKSIAAKIEPMPQGWLKITPANPLTPGEYGLVELMNGKGELNLNMQSRYLPDNIWDFGMDPAAPANAMAIMPEETPAAKPPELQKPADGPSN